MELGPAAHRNRTRCPACAKAARLFNPPAVTEAQRATFHQYLGRMSRRDLAARMGLSESACQRYARWMRVSTANQAPKTVSERWLVEFVRHHGEQEAEARYGGGTDVAGILDRRRRNRRWCAWTDEQVIQLARMGPFLPLAEQKGRLGRKGITETGISSFWHRAMRVAPTTLHGLSSAYAKVLCQPHTPSVAVKVLRKSRYGKTVQRMVGRRIVLWVDAERHLRGGTPKCLKDAVRAMARFQRWLYQPDEVREAVRRIQGASGELVQQL